MKGVTTKRDTENEMLDEIKKAYKKIHDQRDTIDHLKRQYYRIDLENDNLTRNNAWLITWAILSIIIIIALVFRQFDA